MKPRRPDLADLPGRMAGLLRIVVGWLRRFAAWRPDFSSRLRRSRQERQRSTLLPFELVKYFSFTSL